MVRSLTRWGRMTHIYVGNLTIIVSDNGLSPERRHAIIWTNAAILLIGPLRTNFNAILIEIYAFSFRKMPLKMSSGKWRPFCHGLNVLNDCYHITKCFPRRIQRNQPFRVHIYSFDELTGLEMLQNMGQYITSPSFCLRHFIKKDVNVIRDTH